MRFLSSRAFSNEPSNSQSICTGLMASCFGTQIPSRESRQSSMSSRPTARLYTRTLSAKRLRNLVSTVLTKDPIYLSIYLSLSLSMTMNITTTTTTTYCSRHTCSPKPGLGILTTCRTTIACDLGCHSEAIS